MNPPLSIIVWPLPLPLSWTLAPNAEGWWRCCSRFAPCFCAAAEGLGLEPETFAAFIALFASAAC